jgi:hypothetical protein
MMEERLKASFRRFAWGRFPLLGLGICIWPAAFTQRNNNNNNVYISQRKAYESIPMG